MIKLLPKKHNTENSTSPHLVPCLATHRLPTFVQNTALFLSIQSFFVSFVLALSTLGPTSAQPGPSPGHFRAGQHQALQTRAPSASLTPGQTQLACPRLEGVKAEGRGRACPAQAPVQERPSSEAPCVPSQLTGPLSCCWGVVPLEAPCPLLQCQWVRSCSGSGLAV